MAGCHIVKLNEDEAEVGVDFNTEGWTQVKVLPLEEARRIFNKLQIELNLEESRFR